ncbi:hypothetical protein M3P19_00880 [Muricauda sp. 2012CJ35-5]|uniref:Uncharacterized protein n=1 Tax=Flagellimonas spongiicola TaxID=2942208 RepID=A0ABT0PMC9_9FLAO|nr:hypothetical protein [Allomuricauda spongiicola]MCL6272539.1 hypothetical protein [Allomuricauda spongiicola]
MGWLIVLFFFIVLPILGYLLFTGIFDMFFKAGDVDLNLSPRKYIDKSTHYHYHDNRQIHIDGERFNTLKKNTDENP